MGRVIGYALTHIRFAVTLLPLPRQGITVMDCRYLPSVGRVTIIMNDQPIVKYLLIGVLAIFVLTSKE